MKFLDLFKSKDSSPEPQQVAAIGKSTETVALFLEEVGKHGLDLDETEAAVRSEQFRIWVEHIRSGSAVPGLSGTHPRKRHWTAVQKFFLKQRKEECAHVSSGLTELRHLLWTFVKASSQSLGGEKITDTTVVKQLARLKTALEGNSVESIKREAAPALSLLTQLTTERRSRQDEQLKQLGQKLRGLRNELDQARKLLEIDALTRLYNRHAFDQQVTRIADISVFAGKATTLMMLDIDHFKKINDTYGHPGGDVVLKSIANIFIDAFPRKSDFVARYGGEEFAIILQEDGAEVARGLASRLLERIRASSFEHDGRKISVTISIGIAEYSASETPDAWIKRADSALYQAKETGRDRLAVSLEKPSLTAVSA